MKDVLKLALEALESERDKYLEWGDEDGAPDDVYEAITAIKQALEQPVQEHVADRLRVVEGLLLKFQSVASNMARTHPKYMGKAMDDETYAHFAKARDETIPALRAELLNLYTTPPAAQRQWVGLTDEKIKQLADKHLDVGDGERGTHYVFGDVEFTRAIEAELKELNT